MEHRTLLQADYLDIIFDKRNKQYGGYELRKHYNRRLGKAAASLLLIVAGIACFSFVTSSHTDITHGNTVVIAPTIIDLTPHQKPTVQVVHEVPPPAAPPVKTKLFVPPVVSRTDDVPDDKQLTQNKDLKDADPGRANMDGDSASLGIAPGKGTLHPDIIIAPSKPEPPHIWVDQMPQFAGDMNAYIGDHIKYPDAARESRIEGSVLIKFVVNEDGSVSDAIVVRGMGGGCDDEALRMVKGMPKWKPGKQNGIAVKVLFTLPIKFELN